MSKSFSIILPDAQKPVYARFQFAPAVRMGDQIVVSGIIGLGADRSLPPDVTGQAENIFNALEALLAEAGAGLADVASLQSFHVGDVASHMGEFIPVKTRRLGEPHPAWTAVGVTGLAVPGALLEVAAVAYAPVR